MEVHGGADIHLQPMEDPMLEQVDASFRQAPGRTCSPVERGAHARELDHNCRQIIGSQARISLVSERFTWE
ncbi:AN1-type zinc finger protein 5-like [Grus japonensis]|uniref:AN1-type zinc finger protein 5-like n=1 Tax=Grus japonensis TaxID=30415 RepID=A0ABC9WJI8_GRUJA